MRTALAIVGVLGVAACTGTPTGRTQSQVERHVVRVAESDVRCRRETPLGSRVARRVCLTAEDERRRRESTAEFVTAMRRSTPAH